MNKANKELFSEYQNELDKIPSLLSRTAISLASFVAL